jgi:hypothetical protein
MATVPSPPAPAALQSLPPSPPMAPDELIDAWEGLRRRFSQLLHQQELDAPWLLELEGLAQQMRELAGRDTDGALYLLFHAAGHDLDAYSAQHAMVCAVVAELAARWLAWPEEELRPLVMAALTMNVGMTAAQDTLARQSDSPSAEQRRIIDGHAEAGAALLQDAGVQDALWLQIVRLHHTPAAAPLAEDGPPGPRLAELLHRIDVYTAKLSRRGGREAATPAMAARAGFLGAGGHPDSIGATLLRVLGLYPPGTFVALTSGELAVVVRRGEKAHTPIVVSLRRADGGLLLQPARRDCSLRSQAVLNGLRAASVRVRPNHTRVLTAAHAPARRPPRPAEPAVAVQAEKEKT